VVKTLARVQERLHWYGSIVQTRGEGYSHGSETHGSELGRPSIPNSSVWKHPYRIHRYGSIVQTRGEGYSHGSETHGSELGS
jgi:hypothetical protein